MDFKVIKCICLKHLIVWFLRPYWFFKIYINIFMVIFKWLWNLVVDKELLCFWRGLQKVVFRCDLVEVVEIIQDRIDQACNVATHEQEDQEDIPPRSKHFGLHKGVRHHHNVLILLYQEFFVFHQGFNGFSWLTPSWNHNHLILLLELFDLLLPFPFSLEVNQVLGVRVWVHI